MVVGASGSLGASKLRKVAKPGVVDDLCLLLSLCFLPVLAVLVRTAAWTASTPYACSCPCACASSSCLLLVLGLCFRGRHRRAVDHVVLAPELLSHVLVQLGVVELVAAAVAEDPADQAGDRDQVLERERLRTVQVSEGRVLGRHHRQVVEGLLGLRDVGVDAVYVVGGVGQDLGAVGPVRDPEVDLVDQVLLGVGLVGPHLLVHAHVGAAGERGQVSLARRGAARR